MQVLYKYENGQRIAVSDFGGGGGTTGATGPQGPTGPQGATGPGGGGSSFTVQYPDIWEGTAPTTAEEAINRLSILLYGRTIISGKLNQSPSNAKALRLTGFTTNNFDIFVVKCDSNGIPQWGATIAGAVNNETTALNAITADASGNVYVTGTYPSSGLTIFNADGTTFGTLGQTALGDAFIVKYRSDGVVQWATRIAGASIDNGTSVTVDGSGNVYVAGNYSSTTLTIFNADGSPFGTTLANTSGNNQGFIAKYNSAGTVSWVTRIIGTSSTITDITLDTSANIYVTGNYTSTLTIYNSGGTSPFGTTLANSGSNDIHILKYDSGGTVTWVTRIAGSTGDLGAGITLDSSGNPYVSIYLGGAAAGTLVTFFNQDGTSIVTTTNGVNNMIHIAKYNSAGFAQWVLRPGYVFVNNSPPITSDSTGIYTVSSGNFIFPNGTYVYNIDDTIFTKTNNGNAIIKYNTNGFAQWVGTISGSGTVGIFANSTGLYITGTFNTELIVKSPGF